MTRKKPHKSHKSTTSVSIHPDAEEFSSNTAMCINKCWAEEKRCPYDFVSKPLRDYLTPVTKLY